MTHPLDNPIWHALGGPLARFVDGETRERVRRFDPEVSIFGAVDALDASAWQALAESTGLGGAVFLFRDEVAAPPRGWKEIYRAPTLQMVAGEIAEAPEIGVETLSEDDLKEMLALTKLTEPGPFLPRTRELGTYVGVRRGGQLVAMAGERFQLKGWSEISAVCTHPDARRQGLGAALTLWMAQQIRARGNEAFLHVVEENENARRLYEAIGFTLRRKVDVVAAVWEGLQAETG